MRLSRKCQYALQAALELALRHGAGPVKIPDIAEAQGIPPRFLEMILNELRLAGIVESRRGNTGGYMLARPAHRITAAEVLGCFESPIFGPRDTKNQAPGFGSHALTQLWAEVAKVISEVCDNVSLADLVTIEKAKREQGALNYAI
jgi:Rrf2 family cysteine metabolism transcriptional repressor